MGLSDQGSAERGKLFADRVTLPFRLWRSSVEGVQSSTSSVSRKARRPNDVRIDCKAAKHSDGDRGAVLAHLEAELREPRRRSSVDCSSSPLGLRANKRRFVNLLQQLGRGTR